MRAIVVENYDSTWPITFESLRSRLWPILQDIALGIEHIGSTSVPGLAAKPIIDMTIVLPSANEVPEVIERLATLGYLHRGDLGLPGREAFDSPPELPAHHLYVCPSGTLGLANPIALRDYLRVHPDAAREYGDLKKTLAERFPYDMESYIDGKTDFIVGILREVGFVSEQLVAIERMNRKPARDGDFVA